MAYRIVYGTESHKRRKINRWTLAASLVGLSALVLLYRLSGMDEIILNFLLPGDPDTTLAAAWTMIQSIQDGAAVKDAFFVFCQEIIDHAKVY